MLDHPVSRALVGATLVLGAVAACDSTPTAPEAVADQAVAAGAESPALTATVLKDLASLRAYASPLHKLARAMEAGFDTPLTECRDNPGVGGMGYHYGNLSRIDGAVPTVLEPEVLVYAPRSNGKIDLAAVEYVIPFGLWAGAAPPTLFEETFRANTGDGVWQLHVWLWRHNPAGLFEDWNPAVSCG